MSVVYERESVRGRESEREREKGVERERERCRERERERERENNLYCVFLITVQKVLVNLNLSDVECCMYNDKNIIFLSIFQKKSQINILAKFFRLTLRRWH